ncbi:MAG TPA: sulfite exporter TauE/SafE family protein, partial [Acidimicrobiales bacterium]|nr:sulfite exporter TauE/SafE family protein [Acidimicrobiales bacterium]
AVAGAALLLSLPHETFRRVVPALILLAVVLVALQPWLSKRLAAHAHRRPHGGGWLFGLIALVSVYGGYFGAAQSVIYMALLGSFLRDDLQRLNAAKNVLALTNGVVAAVVFVAATHVSWSAAGLLAGGAVVGGQIGGFLGRRLRPAFLRLVIIAVGITAAVVLLV